MNAHTTGAETAPTPKSIQVRRIVAAGGTPEMARELAIIAFPVDRRDDLALLHELTLNRCSAASTEVRS